MPTKAMSTLLRDPPLVLVVDSNPLARRQIEGILHGAGYLVAHAISLDEAVDRFDYYSPDACIMNLRKDIIPTIERLRELDPTVNYMGIIEQDFVLAMHAVNQGYVRTFLDAEGSLDERCIPASADERQGRTSGTVEREAHQEGLAERDWPQELLQAMDLVLDATKNERSLLLHEFARQYYAHGLDRKGHDEPPVIVGAELGPAMKLISDRHLLGTERRFVADSGVGVSQASQIDPHKHYPPNQAGSVAKKFTPRGLEAFLENAAACRLKRLRHVRPAAIYPEGEDYYVLNPLVFGPSAEELFGIVGEIDRPLAPAIREGIIRAELSNLKSWQETSIKVVTSLEEIMSFYVKMAGRSLDALTTKSVDERISWLLGEDPPEIPGRRRISPKEIELFEAALDGFSAPDYAPQYDNLIHRLRDASPQNVRYKLGIMHPSPEELPSLLLHERHKESLRKGKEPVREKVVMSVRLKMMKLEYVVDSHERDGHVLEDFIHFFHSPELGFSDADKLWAFQWYVPKVLEKPDAGLWKDYALLGVSKALRKQNLILDQYSETNMKRYSLGRITEMEYRSNAAIYARKAASWGEEALRFAALGYLVEKAIQDGQKTFNSIGKAMDPSALPGLMAQLGETRAPVPSRKFAFDERMHYLAKACADYAVPSAEVTKFLAASTM